MFGIGSFKKCLNMSKNSPKTRIKRDKQKGERCKMSLYLPEIECPKCGREDIPYWDSDEFDAFGSDGKSSTFCKREGVWRTQCCDVVLENYEPEFDIE
jgi:hypothetical protein